MLAILVDICSNQIKPSEKAPDTKQSAVEPCARTFQSFLHVLRVVNRTHESESGIPWDRTVRAPHVVDADCERLVVRR